MNRRRFLIGAGAVIALSTGPGKATPATVTAAIRAAIGDTDVKPGRVKLDIPLLVENGNAVSMTVTMADPLGAGERVRSLHVFADGNPLPNVMNVSFGPRAGAPRIATRIRLATSQTVTAIVRMQDGTCWSDSVELLVTLAACVDPG